MKKLYSLLLVFLMTTVVPAQSIQELRDSMEAGNLNCQVDFALRYLMGDSIEQNEEEAIRLIRDAADRGNRYGQFWLGFCYESGTGVEKNEQEALRWFQQSADKGNPMAECRMGQAYYLGEGVEQDTEKAVDYFKLSANSGYHLGQMMLAYCYENADGVERDLQKAFQLYKLSAEQGNDVAQMSLAAYYFNGWGTDSPNKEEAVRLLKGLEDSDQKEDAQGFLESIERNDTISAYFLQFNYIPSLLWAYEQGDLKHLSLYDTMNWQLHLGRQFISCYEWEWKDIIPSGHLFRDSVEVIVYRLPEPQRPPLCLYAAAVIDKKEGKCFYYTLEKTINLSEDQDPKKDWMFCGVNQEGSHLNFGYYGQPLDEESFVERVVWQMHSDEGPSASTDIRPKKAP